MFLREVEGRADEEASMQNMFKSTFAHGLYKLWEKEPVDGD